MPSARSILLKTPERIPRSEALGVQAWLGHEPIRFATEDVSLAPVPEAFASATLLPAMLHRATLVSEAPVDADWLSGSRQVARLANRWWNVPERAALAPVRPHHQFGARPVRSTALAFSGGVDSLYTLLHSDERVAHLLFAHGYDVPLNDQRTFARARPHLQAVANEAGVPLHVIRSDLRLHPYLRWQNWHVTHGGAVAALGHLFSHTADQLLIASSTKKDYSERLGSHADLDSHWSSSELRVIHHGADVSRNEKVVAIAGEDIVADHLRVCWQRTEHLNCSRCDKCVCTMIELAYAGGLDRSRVFDRPTDLAARVDAIPRTIFRYTYAELLEWGLTPSLDRAVRDLLARSPEFRFGGWKHQVRKAFRYLPLDWIPGGRRTPQSMT